MIWWLKIYHRLGVRNVENTFIRANEVAEILGVSKSYAYKLIKKLNNQLKEQGYLTISGRINKQYFLEKVCYESKNK